MKLKHYNPIKFLIGIWAILISIIKFLFAKIFFSVPRRIDQSLKKSNCIISTVEFKNNSKFENIVKEISTLFNNLENTDSFVTVLNNKFVKGFVSNGSAYYLVNKALPLKSIIEVIENSILFDTLQKHFGCQFYCRNVSVFKTSPNPNGTTSTYFHRDGHPPFNFKILIYISDVIDIDYGPTSILKSTSKFVIPGWGRYTYDRPYSDNLYRSNVVLGNAGTAVLFDTNTLHAGGRTKRGERIIMTVQLVPKFSNSINSFISSSTIEAGSREYDLKIPLF